MDPTRYARALRDFADGVHSVSEDLKVFPAGLANFMVESKTHEFIQALAPLFNDGTLFALNLHSYMNHKDIVGNLIRTPNRNFAQRKYENGITANIHYCSAEWNMRGRSLTTEERCRRLFTLIWDQVGVVGARGNNDHRVLFAAIYQLWGADPDRSYVLALNRPGYGKPWQPKPRGTVLKMILDQTAGTSFTDISPQEHGRYELEDPGRKKIWVVQNRSGWRAEGATDTIILDTIPDYATHLETWYWDGMMSRTARDGSTMHFPVRTEETVMICAVADK